MKRIVLLAALLPLFASCGHKAIDLQAHRGGAGLMPENTISAMKNAMDLGGINTLEFDLQLSADKQVVVSHPGLYCFPS